ncbi:MAG: hypothetical protein FWF23_04100 [Alphaproteobacteria bacterium]|nr:hypothetical protein [Alphaproteobacteria bacterium]MCL2504854.1 hypothetical protein [Alphaproteobacteria bacterium]
MFDKISGLFVDLYAFTMAQTAWRAGDLERRSKSEIFFRQPISTATTIVPYFVVSGIASFFKWFNNWHISKDQQEWLASVTAATGEKIFEKEFIEFLSNPKWDLSFEFIPEGELAFPGEPVGYVSGPHWQTQLIEAAVLNSITAETIWATIASQYYIAAKTDAKRAKLYDFGARRVAEFGGLRVARSAYLAGWDGSSTLEPCYIYGIPAAGTVAHSFIMSQRSQKEAFKLWAENNLEALNVCLPDTYGTERGVLDFLEVCKEISIPAKGVRIDAGDPDYFSRLIRQMLDKAGYKNATIMYSDAPSISDVYNLMRNEALIDSFGIGTHLARQSIDETKTSAVMKTCEATDKHGAFNVMKFSDDSIKYGVPGYHKIARIVGANGNYAGDILYREDLVTLGNSTLDTEIFSYTSIPGRNPFKIFSPDTQYYNPMVVFMKNGKHVFKKFEGLTDDKGILQDSRNRFFTSIERLDIAHKNIINQRLYIVGIEESLHKEIESAVHNNIMANNRLGGI